MQKPPLMHLDLLLPFQVFADLNGVTRMVVETSIGALGLLPQRLDCVATLLPGILIYQREGQAEVYVAVDAGVLIKTGADVTVSVRNAISGTDLGQLREAVEREFLTIDADEVSVRQVMAKLESGFLRRLSGLHRE